MREYYTVQSKQFKILKTPDTPDEVNNNLKTVDVPVIETNISVSQIFTEEC